MTTTDDRPAVTYCPSWCREERQHHGDLHQTSPIGIYGKTTTLFVEAVQDATTLDAREEVTMHDSDNLLFAESPSVARSIAAALVAAADRAEGLR